MFGLRMVAYLLLTALTLGALPYPSFCSAGSNDPDDRAPVDQPMKESEESEESRGETEVETTDVLCSAAICQQFDSINCHPSSAIDLEVCALTNGVAHGSDHSRAPPAIS